MKIRLKRYTFNIRGKYAGICAAIAALCIAIMFIPWGWAIMLGIGLISGVSYWAARLRCPSSTPLPKLCVRQVNNQIIPPDADQFRFAVIGDMPTKGPARKSVIRHAQKFAPLFVCHTGDVVKYANPKTWRGYIRFLERHLSPEIPMFHTPGNHDIDHNLLRRYYKFYQHYLGQENYVLDAGEHWRFIFWDSARRRISNEQRRFFARALDEAAATNRRVILVTHMPPRYEPAKVTHSLGDKTTRALRRIIKGRDVAAIFCGHIHDLIQFEWEGVPVYIGGLSKDAFHFKPKSPETIIPAGYYRAYVSGRDLRVKPVTLMPHPEHIGAKPAPKMPPLIAV